MRREAAGLLLSDKDLRMIQAALDAGRQVEMFRSLGPLRIRLSTERAGPAWQPHTMLARLEIWDGPVYSTRWCVSAEEVRIYAR